MTAASAVRRVRFCLEFTGFFAIFAASKPGAGQVSRSGGPVTLNPMQHGLLEREARGRHGGRRRAKEEAGRAVPPPREREYEHRHDIRAAQVNLDAQAEAGRPKGRMSRMYCI